MSEVAAYESIVALDLYSSMVYSGIGYWNMGTRGALARGGAMASEDRSGRWIRPSTPLWS